MKITAELICSNILTNYLATAASFIYTILMTPLILRGIGVESYGVWLTCQIVIAYLFYLDFESDTALVKFLAHYWSKGQRDEADGLFTTIFAAYCSIGLIILLLSTFLADLVVPYLRMSEASSKAAVSIVPLIGFDVMIGYLSLAFNCALMAKARYYVINIIRLSTCIAGGISTAYVLSTGGGLIELITVDIALSLLRLASASIYVIKIHRLVTICLHRFNSNYFGRIKTFTLWYFFAHTLNDALTKLATLFISVCFSASHLTAAAMYFKFTDILESITEPVYGYFMPVASSLHGQLDFTRLSRMYLLGTRIVLLILLPGLVLFSAKGNEILELWLGDQFMFLERVLPAVLAAGAINILSRPAHQIVTGVGGVKLTFKAQAFTAGIIVAFLAAMWPLESVAEVVVVFCLADSLIEIFYFVPKSCKFTQIRFSQLIRSAYVPFLVLFLLLWGIVQSYFVLFPKNSYLNFFIISAILGVISLLAGHALLFEKEEIKSIYRAVADMRVLKRGTFLKAKG